MADFGRGRAHVSFTYDMVLGNELQPFDPWQANYLIDVMGTVRTGSVEWGALLHHVSRHFGDRRKDFGIAWNDLGLVVLDDGRAGAWTWQARGVALGTVARGFVDYAANVGGDLTIGRRLSGRYSFIGSGGAHAQFVVDSALERGTQVGGRVEAGLRIEGTRAALELVAGAERRVDADPFEFVPRTWAFAGLRVLTR